MQQEWIEPEQQRRVTRRRKDKANMVDGTNATTQYILSNMKNRSAGCRGTSRCCRLGAEHFGDTQSS